MMGRNDHSSLPKIKLNTTTTRTKFPGSRNRAQKGFIVLEMSILHREGLLDCLDGLTGGLKVYHVKPNEEPLTLAFLN